MPVRYVNIHRLVWMLISSEITCGGALSIPRLLLRLGVSFRVLSRTDQSTFYNPDQPDNLICIDYIFLWKGGPDVWVTEAKVCKQVSCCTITDASDHFPIYVDVTVGNSSLPLLEENVSLGTFSIAHEPIW